MQERQRLEPAATGHGQVEEHQVGEVGGLAMESALDSVAEEKQGRGGTVLQPAITLLENSADFPKEGPLLIITDADCDHLDVHRPHAYLLAPGRRLPFTPRGDVFTMN